jgi:hypothetical protein
VTLCELRYVVKLNPNDVKINPKFGTKLKMERVICNVSGKVDRFVSSMFTAGLSCFAE